jgi:hypothetical protein
MAVARARELHPCAKVWDPYRIPGVNPELSRDFKGSYVFSDMVTQDQTNNTPNNVWIVIELKPSALMKPVRAGKVVCYHKAVFTIVNEAWLSVSHQRGVSPLYVVTDDIQTIRFNDFYEHPENNKIYSDHKFPGRCMKQWTEFIVSDLNKTKWGPCKLTLQYPVHWRKYSFCTLGFFEQKQLPLFCYGLVV